jgi:hypothetical protein
MEIHIIEDGQKTTSFVTQMLYVATKRSTMLGMLLIVPSHVGINF